jgi:hypothetical protein
VLLFHLRAGSSVLMVLSTALFDKSWTLYPAHADWHMSVVLVAGSSH